MNTKMKISPDSDIMARVIQDYINEQELRIKSYESSYDRNEQKIKELEAKKPDDFKPISNPSPSFLKALQAHRLKWINSYHENMEDCKKEIEQIRAKIRDNENLLAMFIEHDFNFITILRNKLMTLKKSLKLIADSVFYILRHCGKSLISEYQTVFDLILATMFELDVSKPIIITKSSLKENYKRCLEMEKKNIDTSLIYGKKIGDVFFPPNVYAIPREIECLNNKITNSSGDISDTSLGRQLCIWLYATMRIISGTSL